MENKEINKKKPTFFWSLFPIITMILLLGVGYAIIGLSAEVLMLVASVIAGIVALGHGYTWEDIIDTIVQKLTKTMPAILVLIVVGFLIGTWMIGGTIPMMIYYGLKVINPNFLILTAFLVTSITSVCTGTSWGSAGTVGVAIMGVAIAMGAPLAIVAGAVVSGAYFGDKLSPLSDTTNLAPIAAGSELYEHIAHMLWTTGPGFIICCIVYTAVGFSQDPGSVSSPESVALVLASIDELFRINIFMIIPVIIVLYGSLRKKPALPIMLFSSGIAILNSVIFQGFTLQQSFDASINGFRLEMFSGVNVASLGSDMATLLQRGGMKSMLGTVLIAFCAYGFAGTLAVTGSLETIMESLTRKVKSRQGIIGSTILATITTVFVTSNGQISLLLPGEMFSKTYIKNGLHPKNLSRTLEDSATVIEPITPWTAAGVYMAGTLGVATIQYLPWAVLNYTGVIFAMIWAITGIGVPKIRKGDKCYAEHVILNEAV
ncbi:sodium:proton antiporter [Alkalispirochaeta sphaeroplastigenens]|uniref:Sodium:proton antiporter n=1 Tax=Alkalispirochaeta sphaeroplastigenens TaxID=1187066 RepID=A0A2S4JI13_9SPIO|nr:Na+/H+ antiporter NhaC [Alkalispirochaeta sphaeroplastigenens]POQ99198.1 sodium:proton antiporter [Alkalispirochaeta sphaeroplastigenens]